MGNWRSDQSKSVRRDVWGRTRGEGDATWKDFSARFKQFPDLFNLKIEKIGSEIHVWRYIAENARKGYWVSCLRFIDDGWGYWTLMFRPDERRWRATNHKDLPVGRMIETAAELYRERFVDTPISD